ncbi:sensor histidine kinase [Nonomuraea sp. NPDC050022]|uniref:sensor histidine kinase n=1 Tax=unclassified Nonomuraea TaxID=2593643 RepID=UPI0033CF575B
MRWNLPRRWACLILGGALLMPYMMAGVLTSGLLQGQSANIYLPAQLGVFVAVLPVVALTGLFLPVRALEVSAAQGLLGVGVETPPRQARRSWEERWRTTAWYTLHLGVGGVASGFTLAGIPFTVFTFAVPFAGGPARLLGFDVEPGWAALGWPLLGLAVLGAVVLVAAGGGALLARLAPALLGPTPGERLAAAERQARTLAERNRLARELHDSVGHALSVVTLQAAAAGRVLDRDPETARTALAAIEQSARAALDDLDHVLGVLREGSPPPEAGPPQATLADLGDLATATGADVRPEVGDLTGVPAVVSREAYRIVQEALTNAIKHGQGPVRLAVAVQDDDLRLEITNRTAANGARSGGRPDAQTKQTHQSSAQPKRPGVEPDGRTATGPDAEPGGRSGGRGVTGMGERVRLLRGDLEAGPVEGGWRVSVRLPLRSAS